MRRAAGGDRWAWERLVNQYARLIWAMTRDFKLMESDAADVAQMTWLRLLKLLMADPPASYAQISSQLGLPVGSIGPTRGRCLARLRDLLQAS